MVELSGSAGEKQQGSQCSQQRLQALTWILSPNSWRREGTAGFLQAKSPGITHISLDNLHFPSLHRGGKQQNGVWVVVVVWLLLFAPKAV